jgi:hypothetical protein
MNWPEQANSQRQKVGVGFQGPEGGEVGVTTDGTGLLFRPI